MSGSTMTLPALVAALAGGLAAVAAREALAATPAAARWLTAAIEPLRRAGREGYLPTDEERQRLSVLGAAGFLAAGLLLVGPGPAPLLSIAGPGAAAWAITRRRARYRAQVERELPQVAIAVADAVSAGRSTRAALAGSVMSLDGVAAVEMARLGADLELGAPVATALGDLQARLGSARVDAFAAALVSHQIGGGDLAGLLRRFAASTAERDRVAAEARSATAQARFTGLLVVAMPAGTALFGELFSPGFVGGLVANPSSAAILAVAAALQIAGFVAIRRLGTISG